MKLRFGELVLDRDAGRLLGPDGEVRLRPQAFRMLVVLAEQAPKILSQEELLNRVWGVEHLSPTSVKQAVCEVRQALGDDPIRPALIETVHRRGYRFIANVERIEEDPPPARRSELAAPGGLRLIPAADLARRRRELAVAAAESRSLRGLAAIGRDLGTDLVVTGSYLVTDVQGEKKLSVQMQVQNVRTGKTVASARESGGLAELPDLAAAAARGIRNSLRGQAGSSGST